MDSRNSINVTPENQHLVFDRHISKTIIPFSSFSRTVTRNPDSLFPSLLPVFLFSTPVPLYPSHSEKFQRHSERNGPSAHRKQLIVRGVRKASLALIFLTSPNDQTYILKATVF